MKQTPWDKDIEVSSNSDGFISYHSLNDVEDLSSDTEQHSSMNTAKLETVSGANSGDISLGKATEPGEELVPTGAAEVSSTDTPGPDPKGAEDSNGDTCTIIERGNSGERAEGEREETPSTSIQPMGTSEPLFRMPIISQKSGKSNGEKTSDKRPNINDKGKETASSGFAVPLPTQGKSPKQGTFAFALPKTLSKSKRGSFQGGETQSKLKESSPSPTDSTSKLLAKKLDEKGKKDIPTAPLPYKEPSWSGIPNEEYHLEVLKNGTILSKIALNDKPYHVFGRLASCDVQMDHPSLSRYHLVLQYRPVGDGDHDPGFYAYDLGSTHGSFLNKQQMKAKAYYRMNIGHMFKLGGSTRLFILQGPPSDEEEGSQMSITELKELRQKQMEQMEEKRRRKEEEKEMAAKKAQEQQSEGIDWGMGGDEEEEDSDEENPFATIETQEEREAAYIKDPKKTLRGFFEREDVELEYEVEEKGSGFSHQFVCRVQLPLDDSVGNPIYAEASVSGKKKEAVVACALEACRILDAHGVLRQAQHESKKRKAKDWAQDDYYDSDDDTFLDRTGDIERKRKQRMKKAGVIKETAETYDSLVTKLAEVEAELVTTEKQLEEAKKVQPTSGDSDTLDDFIASLKAGGSSHDRAQRAKLKFKVVDLRKEQFRLQKLVQVARPAHIPEPPKSKILSKGKALSMIGSMKSKSNFKDRFQPKIQIKAFKKEKEDEMEEEEEEDEVEDPGNVENMVQNDVPKQTANSGTKDEIQPSHPQPKVYGVTMPPPPLTSSQMDDLPGEVDATPVAMETTEEGTSSSSASSRPKRVYGVTMPPSLSAELSHDTIEQSPDAMEQSHDTVVEDEEVPVKSKRMYGPARPPPSKHQSTGYGGDESKHQSALGGMLASLRDDEAAKMDAENEDYTDWQPPTDQKGDGRTALNEKLGY